VSRLAAKQQNRCRPAFRYITRITANDPSMARLRNVARTIFGRHGIIGVNSGGVGGRDPRFLGEGRWDRIDGRGAAGVQNIVVCYMYDLREFK